MQNAGRGLQRAKGGTGVERVSERERESEEAARGI